MKKIVIPIAVVLLCAAAFFLGKTTGKQEKPAIDFQDDQMYAVAYLGYQKAENLDTYLQRYLDGKMPDTYRISGGDIYLVIPRYTDMKMKIMKSDIETETKEVLYEAESSKPFIVHCNVSDIIPDVTIQFEYQGKVMEYTPFISLEDGSVMVGEEGLLLP